MSSCDLPSSSRRTMPDCPAQAACTSADLPSLQVGVKGGRSNEHRAQYSSNACKLAFASMSNRRVFFFPALAAHMSAVTPPLTRMSGSLTTT